jgi:hypothetical protein
LSYKEERRRRRERQREEEIQQTADDIRHIQAQGLKVRLRRGPASAREHLTLEGEEYGEIDKDEFVAQRHERMELTDRVKRLFELDETEDGRAVIREALKRVYKQRPGG